MGMDLTLMPMQYSDLKNHTWWLGYNRLSFDRSYNLFNYFGLDYDDYKNKKVINNKPIPKGIKVDIYGDDGLKTVETNPYGEPLTFFYAEDVKKIPVSKDMSDWNKAIIKFLKALPRKTIVVLEWR